MRTAGHTVPPMLCNCERNNTLSAHEEAVNDAVAMKSLRTQTRNITEQTLQHYAMEEIRNKIHAIIDQQVKESQEVKQTMEKLQTQAQNSFKKMEARAVRKRAAEVLPELDDLVEDDRENVCPLAMDGFLCLSHLTHPYHISLHYTNMMSMK